MNLEKCININLRKMALKLAVIFLVLLSIAQSRGPCAPFHVKYGKHCLLTCSHSIFDDCPDNFPPANGLTVCAYLLDGSKVQYDFGCQPCQNQNTIGITFGPCPILQCLPWQIEVDGQCVDKCTQMECEQGEFCKKGKCKSFCRPWQIEVDGECVDKCVEMECEEGQECRKGKCKRARRECGMGRPCEDGAPCIDGKCL